MTVRRLPALGPRGEGWFALQLGLFAAVAGSGAFGPAWSGATRAVTSAGGATLVAGGGLLALRGVLDLRENLTVFPRPVAGARLVDTGAYRLVRHPIYGGLILGAAGWALITASLPTFGAAALLSAFFRLKSGLEEEWLVAELPGYEAYRRRSRRFVPGLY